MGPLLQASKLGGGWVAYSILVSAQGPLVLGFGTKGFGAKGLGPGLDKNLRLSIILPSKLLSPSGPSPKPKESNPKWEKGNLDSGLPLKSYGACPCQ